MSKFMAADEVISNIRSRMARCRQLAKMTTDERARTILRQMADEGEADIRKLQEGSRSRGGD